MSVHTALENVGRFSYLGWHTLLALPRAALRPGALLPQLSHVLIGALPLAVVAGLAVGVVVWLHTYQLLRYFGAQERLPEGLALAVVLELGPTGAGLILAGRSGASLGAELGSMRLSEQIDALEMLGISPLRQLVAPRVLACIVALPLLTVFMIYVQLTGSFLAELLGGSMGHQQYLRACLRSLRLEEVLPATVKTAVFGYLVGVTGCYFGLMAEGGTEGVGRAATRGVVLSILLVLTSNVMLVGIIRLLVG